MQREVVSLFLHATRPPSVDKSDLILIDYRQSWDNDTPQLWLCALRTLNPALTNLTDNTLQEYIFKTVT